MIQKLWKEDYQIENMEEHIEEMSFTLQRAISGGISVEIWILFSYLSAKWN